MTKISIITPTYNSSRFIKRTIESVLYQTHTDWEYLIVDDNSTDNTTEIINEFIKQDSRIKLFKTQENSGGPATPKNVGIEKAKGEYIAFLDHDDEWLPEKLEKQLQIFEKSNDEKLGLVSCFINIRNNDKGTIIAKHHNLYRDNALKILLQFNFLATSSCIMTKSEVLRNVGLFDTNFRVSDDWDMWIRILKFGYKIDYAPQYLINYFMYEANLSNNKESEIKDFRLLFNKNNTEPTKMGESCFLSFYYYNTKQYKLSRKYYLQNIFSKNLTLLIKTKSLAYLILTFFPKLENYFKKTYRKI